MNRSLFFIPLIETALRQADPVGAMIETFREIESLGHEPSHAEGYKMFMSFIAEVVKYWEMQRRLSGQEAGGVIDALIYQTAGGRLGPDDGRIDRKGLPKGLLALLERQIRMMPVADPKDVPIALDIIRDGETVAIVNLDSRTVFHHVSEILPGAYTFALSSGRVLWEVVLEEKDLLLTAADPGRNLSLAADTGEKHMVRPTLEMVVLGGEVVFRVFPGLERGRIEIGMRPRQ